MYIMRHARWFRLFSALVGFWVPLTIGEPSALRLCAAHQGPMAAQAAGAQHHAHGATAVAAESHQTPAPAHDGSHQHCTCIGCCSTSAARVAVPSAPVAAVIVVAHETSGFSTTVSFRAVSSPDYSRPHTTGPPLALNPARLLGPLVSSGIAS